MRRRRRRQRRCERRGAKDSRAQVIRIGTAPAKALLHCRKGRNTGTKFESQELPPVRLLRSLPALLPALFIADPALASAGTQLPEPSGLLLLGLGIAGVAIGRRLSSRRGKD